MAHLAYRKLFVSLHHGEIVKPLKAVGQIAEPQVGEVLLFRPVAFYKVAFDEPMNFLLDIVGAAKMISVVFGKYPIGKFL